MHSGGDSQRSPTQCVSGKAWSALNSCAKRDGGANRHETCNTPMELLLDHLSGLFAGELQPGSLVVASCDVMLLVPPRAAARAAWSRWSGSDKGPGAGSVAGLAIAASAAKYAPNHGVYCLEDVGDAGDETDGGCPVTPVAR